MTEVDLHRQPDVEVSTRQRVVHTILDQGPATARQLADQLELTAATRSL